MYSVVQLSPLTDTAQHDHGGTPPSQTDKTILCILHLTADHPFSGHTVMHQ
jgi:hypothetical protein